MTKKSLGYVHLVWTCPQCETKVPGPEKICPSCGFPQPDDVEFEQPAQEEIITDEAEIARAKAGPDIHCYYCGTRNPAGAANCSQCGADLSEGAARGSGRTLGAHHSGPAEPITCPACGTENDPDAPKCQQCGASLVQPKAPSDDPKRVKPQPKTRSKGFLRIGIIAIVVAACALFGLFAFLSMRTEDVTGTVEETQWTRSIAIEALRPVDYEDWRDEIPAQAQVGACTQKVHHTQDNPAPDSREICGTPYTKDTGSGFGEVVQDCRYEVYEEWCEYTVDEWREVDTITLTGADFNPQWPTPRLSSGQREGEREEKYQCIFDTPEGERTYTTADLNQYSQCQIGSRWTLQVNTFNAVRSIEPNQ